MCKYRQVCAHLESYMFSSIVEFRTYNPLSIDITHVISLHTWSNLRSSMANTLTLTVLGYFEHLIDWGGGGGRPGRPPYDLGRRMSDEHGNVHVCRYLRKEQDGIISFFLICKFVSL